MSQDWRERLSQLNPDRPKPSFLWLVLVLVGLWFFMAPWIHGEDVFGPAGSNMFLRTIVAFLFFFCAYFSHAMHGLRLKLDETVQAVDVANSALFGKEWKSKRDAVPILINALSSPKDELRKMALDNLKKLTGEDFGSDKEKWEAWWSENRANFRGTVKLDPGERR